MGSGTPRVTGRQRAYDHLRTIVLTDPSRAGTFLNEIELAAEIGVSRTPVREAFLLLAADGLVEMIPQKGAFVPPLTNRALTELFDVRTLIETHAVDVVLHGKHMPTAAMRQALEDQVVLQDGGAEAVRRFIEIDRNFHQLLVDGAGNTLLSQMYTTLRTRQVCAGVAAVADPGRRRAVIEEHCQILEALEAGNPQQARSAVTHHLEVTRDVLREAL